jgi:putative RNA 2'-phosphotransferase
MNYTKLSKEISYALRHAPWEYELELDSVGFVPTEQLLSVINESNSYGREITAVDFEHIIEISDKKRFEIKGDKIRALYGHSVPMHISKEPIVPPAVLYHGTSHKACELILNDGLKPMGRQYVHLSVDTDTALQVGKRRDRQPVILKIDAERASKDGIIFYEGNDKVVLADFVPERYIEILE